MTRFPNLPPLPPLRLPLPEGRLRPLLLPLVAAILLHGLLLAVTQRNRPTPTTADTTVVRENTPELLRLSRSEATRSATLATVPLPPLMPLPPPLASGAPGGSATIRPPRSQAQEAGQVAARGVAASRKRGPSAGSRRSNDLPAPAARVGGTPLDWLRAAELLARNPSESGPASGQPAPGQATTAQAASGQAASGQAASWKAVPSPSTTAQAASGPGGSPGGSLSLLRLEGEAAQPYRRLWQAARPVVDPPEGLRLLPDSTLLRRLPLAVARSLGLPATNRQAVVFEDQLLLLWIDGPSVWLLRSSGTAKSPAEPG